MGDLRTEELPSSTQDTMRRAVLVRQGLTLGVATAVVRHDNCSLIWDANPDDIVRDILNNWNTRVLGPVHLQLSPTTLECWVEGAFADRSYTSFAEAAKDCADFVRNQKIRIRDRLTLLPFNTNAYVLELAFDESERPATITASLRSVPLPGFAKFFSAHHLAGQIRSNGEIAAQLLNRDSSVVPDPLDFLSPMALQ